MLQSTGELSEYEVQGSRNSFRDNIMPMEEHRKIRQLTGRHRSLSKHTGIKGNEGKLLTDESDICQRWSEYIENLYDDPILSDEPLLFDGFLSGPEILKSEMRQAIKTAKNKKSARTR